MKQHHAFNEQRRKPRCDVVGVATLGLASGRVGPCLVINVSASGALLCSPVTVEPGTCLDLELELQGCPRMLCQAQVLRAESLHPDEHYLALRFESLPSHDASLVDQLVREVIRRRQHPEVLIVEDCSRTRDALRRDLRGLGHGSVAVSNPLDAAMCLRDRHLSFASALVGLRVGSSSGLELVELMAEAYPAVGRVLMGDRADVQQLAQSRIVRWVDALLARPWSRLSLASAIQKVLG